MKKRFALPLAFILLLLQNSMLVHADSTKENEIQYLLDFIASSSCSFIRNGKAYPSSEARSHIERKFEYVKSYVDTTEDFIKLAATKSSMSGKVYTVRCADKEQTSNHWLTEALNHYRQSY